MLATYALCVSRLFEGPSCRFRVDCGTLGQCRPVKDSADGPTTATTGSKGDSVWPCRSVRFSVAAIAGNLNSEERPRPSGGSSRRLLRKAGSGDGAACSPARHSIHLLFRFDLPSERLP